MRHSLCPPPPPVSYQEAQGVDVEVVEEVSIRCSTIGTLVLDEEALYAVLAAIALLHHPQLWDGEIKNITCSGAAGGVIITQYLSVAIICVSKRHTC